MKFLHVSVFVSLLGGVVYAWFPTIPPQDHAGTGLSEVSEPLIPPAAWPQPVSAAYINSAVRATLDLTSLDWSGFSHDPQAIFHGHGEQVCASGCSLSRHPTGVLTNKRYRELLAQCNTGPLDADNLAFETLLYFGRQTQALVDTHGTLPLDRNESALLRRELNRQHATVSIRVVDDQGRIRSWVDTVSVPLDRRHVFAMETDGLPPLVTSGTVKRVGLNHLWTRL
jgi:hypothetical protein